MTCLISIGHLDKNIFYPIAAGILSIFLKIIITHGKSKLISNPLILGLDSSLGMSLSFILLIMYKNKNINKNNIIQKKNRNKKCDVKKNKKNNINKSIAIKLEYTNEYEKITTNKYKFFILTSIMDFIQTIVGVFIYFDVKINMWVFDILFMSFFSFIIFDNKIYIHHYISTILIILMGIGIDIVAGYYIFSYGNILKMICKFIDEVIYSLIFIINKYTIEKKFSESYEICFFQGFFCFILFIVLFIVLYILNIYNMLDYFINLNLKEGIIFFSVMIILFLLNIFVLITIEKINVYHVMISIIIAHLGHHIIDLLESNNKIKSIIIIIGLCFIMLMTFIFNEIIEINCCGLSNNTKRNIMLRAGLDSLININNEDNESSRCSEGTDLNSLKQWNGTEISRLNSESIS